MCMLGKVDPAMWRSARPVLFFELRVDTSAESFFEPSRWSLLYHRCRVGRPLRVHSTAVLDGLKDTF